MADIVSPWVNPIRQWRPDRRVLMSAALAAAAMARSAVGQELPVDGVTGAHDPSTIIQEGSNYFYYATGQGIISRTSTDTINWTAGPSVFATQPAWTSTAVPGFTGFFWAPDVIYRNNQYYMYYAVSTFGSQVSAIGLATSPTLNPSDVNYAWTDQGPVIQSTTGSAYNTIDPSLLQNSDGTLWMSFGSYWTGIYLAQLDPTTGQVKSGTSVTHIAANSNNNSNSYFNGIEASYLVQHDGYYYLFENWGACCDGVTSTYNIRVGRSTSITGPYLDENGVALTNGGGSVFLESEGNEIGPGQFSMFTVNGQQEFGYHYYDGNANGAPTEGIRDLFWTASDWPSIAPANPTWTGTSNANWSTAANWSDTVPNGAGNIATFVATTTGHQTITLDGGAKTVVTLNFDSTSSYTIGSASGNGLTLDSGNTNSPTINVEFGSHTIAAPITAKETLGVFIALSTSTLSLGAVSGVGLNKYGAGVLSLTGTNSYTSNIFVHQGSLTITGAVTAATFNSIGDVAGDVGTMTVSGSGSFTSSGDLNIGDTGDSATAATGTLNLSGSGQITINSGGGFYVGSGFYSNTLASGTVTQTGGTLTDNDSADGGFTIGGRTSKLAVGVYNLGAGTVTANTNVWDGGYGTGTMNQTGGAFQSTLFLAIGRETGSTGVWNISGGTLNQTNASDSLIVGEAGAGTLTISGAGQVTTAGTIKLGMSGGSGTINLNGGSLITPGIQRGTGSGTFNFNGGTLKAAASTATFMQGLTGANVDASGAFINDAGYAVTIAQPLLSGVANDGGLTKLGSGTITLTAAESYVGGTKVNGGALTLASGASIAGTSVTVAAGATMNVNGALSSSATLTSNGTTNFGANSGGGILTRTLSSLTVGSAGAVSIAGPVSHGSRTLLVTGSLSFASNSSGAMDMTGNDMVIHNGNVANINSEIGRGYDGGAWNGSGILSSSAAGGSDTALGYELNSNGSTALLNTFDGQTVTSTDVLVKYTYVGDANLDGIVNGSDYTLIDNGLNNGLTNWQNGDFNYDGVVNGDDYTLIDNAFNTQGASLAGMATDMIAVQTSQIATNSSSAVPEPAVAVLAATGVIGFVKRRRRGRLEVDNQAVMLLPIE